MIVAVITVWKMQPVVHEIIDMVTMRDRFVSTIWAVLVRAAGLRCAADEIRGVRAWLDCAATFWAIDACGGKRNARSL